VTDPHFTNRPLAGRTVIVTAERRAQELGAALDRRGAVVVQAPVLSMVSHVDDELLLARTREVVDHPPDVVVVSTGVGFRGWLEAADSVGIGVRLRAALGQARLVARGPKAVGAIQAAGLSADWVAESETTAEIEDLLLLEGVLGLRVAVQHHGAGSEGLDEALAGAGAQVTSLVVYRWGPAPDPAAVAASVHLVGDRRADAVVFTSAPGAWAWLECARTEGRLADVVIACAAPGGVLAAAVGPVTAKPLQDAGIEPVQPERFRLGALVHALTSALVARGDAAG
jgi:uroporphyrinogen-III synthase